MVPERLNCRVAGMANSGLDGGTTVQPFVTPPRVHAPGREAYSTQIVIDEDDVTDRFAATRMEETGERIH